MMVRSLVLAVALVLASGFASAADKGPKAPKVAKHTVRTPKAAKPVVHKGRKVAKHKTGGKLAKHKTRKIKKHKA